jgi:hypothetical protein
MKPVILPTINPLNFSLSLSHAAWLSQLSMDSRLRGNDGFSGGDLVGR